MSQHTWSAKRTHHGDLELRLERDGRTTVLVLSDSYFAEVDALRKADGEQIDCPDIEEIWSELQ